MSTDIQPFDFRTAGATDVVVSTFKRWLAKAAGTFTDAWEAVSDSMVELECQSVLSRTYEEGLQSLHAESIGWEIFLGDNRVPTLACVSYLDLVSLIGCVIGTGPVDKFEFRKLTSIETSLSQLIFDTLGSSLSAAWTGDRPLPVTIGAFEETPQYSRLILAKDLVLCTRLKLRATEATAEVLWFLPRKELQELLEGLIGTSLKMPSHHPEFVVRKIALELVTMLGRANMTMGELEDLKIGDLVILDQRIDDPLEIHIDHRTLFLGWPGRLAKWQAIEIAKAL